MYIKTEIEIALDTPNAVFKITDIDLGLQKREFGSLLTTLALLQGK